MSRETNETPDSDNQGPVKARVGRKTKYSETLIKKLLSFISDGLNNKQACQAVGIGETTLREWRAAHEGLEERLQAAREVLRAKVLGQIRAAGAKDWRAHVEFLRLSFSEDRFGSGPTNVNVALQNNISLEERDPERARLIAELEEQRARALANTSCVEAPLQLADAGDSQEKALAAERQLKEERTVEVRVEPVRAYEQPPKTVVERADLREERRQWREAARRDEVEELLGD